MKIANDSLQQVPKLLALLDRKLRQEELTPAQLQKMQERLDAIDAANNNANQSEYYQDMLELQALLYVQADKETEAQEFLDEALSYAGSVKNLHSECLRQYAGQGDTAVASKAKADFSAFTEKERKFMSSYKIDEHTNIRFFVRQPALFLIFSLLTFGLYDLYWFNMNWIAVRKATGQKMSPFWRAFFVVFYAWPLFKIIRLYARAHGYQKSYSAGWLATAYILLTWTSTAINRAPVYNVGSLAGEIVVTILGVIILVTVQQAALYSNQVLEPNTPEGAGYRKTEIVFIVIFGVIMIGLTAFILASPGSKLNPAQQAQADSMKAQIDDLTNRYHTCSADLLSRQNSVDTSSQAAVDAYNTDYDNCESVRQQQNQLVEQYNRFIGAD